VDLHDPAVGAVVFAADEALLLEPGHDPTHRRRPDLFRLGELAQSPRASEDKDGESREPSRAQPARGILAAGEAKRMDGCGVESIGRS
jgi:hypothetical protein